MIVRLHALLLAAILIGASLGQEAVSAPTQQRAFWVWKPREILLDDRKLQRFLSDAKALRLTDTYLYFTSEDYRELDAELSRFIGLLRQIGVAAWGLDGWRGYFSDASGPEDLYAVVDAMIAFNSRHPSEGFIGFHSDLEPQDGQGVGESLFHNDVASSALSQSQKADRDRLMADWVSIHLALHEKLKSVGLSYGGSFPSWLDDYEGEPVLVTRQGIQREVLSELLSVVDEYVVMSYSTNLEGIVRKVSGELTLAKRKNFKTPILWSLEVHPGAGRGVSYADTPPKSTRAAVLGDIETLSAKSGPSAGAAGFAIHDWEGWDALK